MNRRPLLIAAALVSAFVSSATAEPVTDPAQVWTTYHVNITSQQDASGNELLKHPFSITFDVCLCGTQVDESYFGTPIFGDIPLNDNDPPLLSGEMLLDFEAGRSILQGRWSPFFGQSLFMSKPLDGNVPMTTADYRAFMSTGELDFTYRDIDRDPVSGDLTLSYVYRGTAHASVPEPSIFLSLLTGGAAFTLRRRRSAASV